MPMNPEETARAVNTLGAFLGCRYVPALTQDALRKAYGFAQADVMVLFGGSILCGGDVLAQAIRTGLARRYVIVGGAGHTTETLRRSMRRLHPQVETENQPEAVIFDRYLRAVYGLRADWLETQSTNCGNNITHLLALLEEKGFAFDSIILCQDATMQRRMDAVLRKYAPDKRILNYAAYRAAVVLRDGAPVYARDIPGMWAFERYLTLLLGEIPRLTDDADGYGPNGKNFLAHVDIPADVRAAFERLRRAPGPAPRAADPRFASV